MSESETTGSTAFEEVQASTTGPIEMMRELAEQNASDSSSDDWIPEAYRRDTIEETARVLLKSQKDAQREMHRATQARADLERRNQELEQTLQALFADAPSAESPRSVFDQFEDAQPNYAAPPQFDHQQIAAMAVQEKLMTPAANAIADEAERLAASQVPGFDADRVFAAINANPSLIAGAAATGDPQQIAAVLADVHQGTSAQPVDLMRTMKIQAQSAMGAGGRSLGVSDAEQRWQEITNASDGKLGL